MISRIYCGIGVPILALIFAMLSFEAVAQTYYSQGTDNFSSLTNWDTNPGGGGTDPLVGALTSGAATWIVQIGHVITLDQAIDVASIQITGGTLNSDGTNAISATGGASSFTMNSGVFSIAGTATFPSEFETITLSGGTITYDGANQTVANQDADGDPFSYNNLILGGTATKTAPGNISVNGSLTITTGVTFAAGAFTHTISGSIDEQNTAVISGTSTFILNSSGFQVVNNTVNNNYVDFHNLIVNGGGTVSIGGRIRVYGDFTISNNSLVTGSQDRIFFEDFTIDAGSNYDQTGNTTYFDGTGVQNIVLTGTNTFNALQFRNGAPNAKNITGNLNITGQLTVTNTATISDAVPGNVHFIGTNLRIDGTANLIGTVTFNGQLQDLDDDNISLACNLITNNGSIRVNTTVNVSGDFSVLTGNFNALDGSTLVGTPGATFTLAGTSTYNAQGIDNFPDDFGTYDISTTSRILYNRNGDQTIRGGFTIGELEVGGSGIKTVDGALTVNTLLDMNNGITLNFGAFTHTINTTFQNGTGSTLLSTGTINLNVQDANTAIIQAGTYTFNNLIIDSPSLTATRVYTIQAPLTVNGNFSVSNNGGNDINVLIMDPNDEIISNDGGDTFTLNENVEWRTSGATNFPTTVGSFASVVLNSNSTIRYDGGVNQSIVSLSYGNLQFAGNSNKSALGPLDIQGNFERVGNTPIFVDGGFAHTVSGNWNLATAYYNTPISTITLNGAGQIIQVGSTFNNLVMGGSGTKQLNANIVVNGNLTINDGVTFEASNSNINISGNWNNGGTGIFTQTTGITTFQGSTGNQNINNNPSSTFGTVTIDKTAGLRQVTSLNDLRMAGSLNLNSNAIFVTNDQNVYINNDLTINTGSTWTDNSNSTLFFVGSTLQELNNIQPSTFNNITFNSSGTVRIDNNGIDVVGNISIGSGATVNFQNLTHTIQGNWTNNGSFLGNGTIQFNGTNQTINSSDFFRIQLSNSGTKTLAGGISVTDDIIIDVGVTLDVSASNHSITIGDDWTNNGIFNARNGLVTFNGNVGLLNAGGTGPNNRFYNINVSKNSGQRVDLGSDVEIDGNLTITAGILRTNANSILLSGSLINNSSFEVNNAAATITLDGTSGTHSIQSGASSLRNIVINAPGAIYELGSDLTLINNHSITIDNGSFLHNGFDVTIGGTGIVTLNAGTYSINEGATLFLPNNSSFTNNGGTFRLVGVDGNVARLDRNGGTGGYTYTQNSGTFNARFYEIISTSTTGITISGGSIDATNNFRDGKFLNGAGTQYLNLNGLNFADFSVDDVVFNAGPTYNVTRTSGTGVITFADPSGSLAGETFENDAGDRIEWTFPSGVFWDGLGDGITWSDGLNWSSNTIPDLNNNIFLDHSVVVGAYTVRISAANAEAGRLTIDDGGGAAITLELRSGYDLDVDGNVQISANSVLSFIDPGSVMFVEEDFSNSGTINPGTGRFEFDNIGGSYALNAGGASFYDLTINAPSTTYTLGSALTILNDIVLTDGTLDVSSSNYALNISGDWSNVGLTTFNARSGTVTLELGGASTQTISGGPFYNLTTVNSTGIGTATKQLTGNVSVQNDLVIQANSRLDAQTFNLFVGRNWTNNSGTTAFTQTGVATVTFNGTVAQNLDNGAFATTFNNLVFAGTNTVNLQNSSVVNGDVQISFGVGTFDLISGQINGAGPSNTLTVSGSSLLRVRDNNFPTGFETIDLASNSTVEYRSNNDEDIFPTTYGNLRVMRNNAGNLNTKTAQGNLVVLGTLTVNDTDTELDLDGNDLTLTGNFAFPAGGRNIVWGGGTFTHNGADWNIDADLSEFPSFVLAGTGTKRMFTNLNITGNVAVQNGVILRTDTYTLTATGAGVQSFSVNNGAEYRTQVPTATSPAIPISFDSYSFGITSTLRLDGAAPQTISSIPVYGNVLMQGGSSVAANGVLTVEGDFTTGNSTFTDGNNNLFLNGADIQLNNYTASAASTLTLGGVDQTLRETSTNTFNLRNIVFGGSGTKTFGDGNDTFTILGNFTINNGVTVSTNRNITFSGATFTNNGTFEHTGNTFTFNRNSAMSINPGANNEFNVVVFSGSGTKTFNTHGGNFTNTFTKTGGNVNLGALTHSFGYGGANFTTTGAFNASNATLIFNGGNQTIPQLTVGQVQFSNAGTKILAGDLTSNNDIIIDNGVTFDVSVDNYSVTLRGDWLNSGNFTDRTGLVTFDGSSSPVTVQSNGSNFYDVGFSPGASVTYNITSASTRVDRSMNIDADASVDLNGNTLILGSNQPGKTFSVDGLLEIDENAIVQFDNNGSATAMTVTGTLRVVGTNANLATITAVNVANTRRPELIIDAGGTIEAEYYLIEYLDSNGLQIMTGATIDATRNLSNGTFANLVTAGGGPHYYIQTNSAAAPVAPINDLNFSFSGTPTPGTHVNIQRDNLAGSVITIGGTGAGSLYGEAYEIDPGNNITWPAAATATWTGGISNDWHTAANWSTGSVPIATTSVTIPLETNNPVISTSNAECNDLTITTGNLTVSAGFDLTINGDANIGTSPGGALVVTDPASAIEVEGSWTRGASGIFSAGSGTVTFVASSGSVNIQPRTSAFHNISFTGNANFVIVGDMDVNGNLIQDNGTINPSTNNHTISIAGNYTINAGAYSTTTNGTVVFDGANQQITNGYFDNVQVAGTGNKTFNGTNFFNDDLTISSTLVTAVGATLDMNDPVTINVGGTFNDAGAGNHTFAGATWTNNGTFSGTGTITFDGGNQNIGASSFHNLTFAGTGVKTLTGNITIANDFTATDSFTRVDFSTFTTTGTVSGTFTVDDGQTLYVFGTNNFPSGFGFYTLGANTITDYRGSINQTIRGGVAYGNLYIRNATTKSLGGNIIIQRDLFFNDATLDVTANNYSINIGDDWFNNGTGSFVARFGDVIFDGSELQQIRSSLTGTKDFYKITVNSTDQVRFDDEDATIGNNLTVAGGIFNPNTRTVTIGGDLNATGGTISTSGVLFLNSSIGSNIIRTNGSILNTLTIDAPSNTYTVQDDLSLIGDFNLVNGTFDGNGYTISLGNGVADNATINGTYIVGENGTLAIGNATSLTVGATGVLFVVGTGGNPATVTRGINNGTYAFQVNGTIHARNYLFEYMNASGIFLNTSSTIDATNNFSDGTFRNGTNNGTYLRIENTQTLTINNVNFATVIGGTSANVMKVTSASGVITFDNASGPFAGPSYEDDPNDLIVWPTPITLTWQGGTSTDWFTATNWVASSGPNIVPTGAEDVIIAPATNQPNITVAGALANNLIIQNAATLVLSTNADADNDLVVAGNLEINGTLTVSSNEDFITVGGGWIKGGSGTFNNGSSTLIFNASSGSHTINNGLTSFFNVEINATATYVLGSNTNINRDLVITAGTLDVTNSNFSLTVGGSWTNAGTFTSRNGTVTLNRSAAVTVPFSPGASAFNNLTINGGASTIFQLQSGMVVNGNVTITSSTLDANGNTFTLGDGVGSDQLSITGTLDIDANASLLLGPNATVTVNSGGTFRTVGTDDSNLATVTRTGSGRYGFIVSSGATIHAQYYLLEFVNSSGYQVSAGATIDATNNFSNGTFSNGAAGGRYLNLISLTTNHTAENVTFNSGPSINVRATSGTGNFILFEDASGTLAGPTFEDDDGNPNTGAVRWISTSTIFTWTGATDSDWDDPTNWYDGMIVPAIVPNATIDVIIPNVATNPVISAGPALANNLTIQSGGVLTLQGNQNLTVSGSFSSDGTFTVPGGSTSQLSVGINFANSGTFNQGNAATLRLTSASGLRSIDLGGASLNNLILDGNASFVLTNNLVLNGSLTINQGSLDVTTNNYSITVGGDWTNLATFVPRLGTVTFNGGGPRNLDAGGTGATKRFNNVTINKSSTINLTSNMYVSGNMTLTAGALNAGANTLQVVGNWSNSLATFTAGTSTVEFIGNSSMLLSTNGQAFNNVTVNKTGGSQVSQSSNIAVNGTLNVPAGTLFLNGRSLDFGDGADNISVSGTLSIDGGASLRMHQNSSGTVNGGGNLRVIGASAANLATITSRSATAGWNFTINGTINARFAQFLYSGGDGISVTGSGTVNATNNFSNSSFDDGIGNAYLTINNNQTFTATNVTFDQGVSPPTYNVSTTSGTGVYTFSNYSGLHSGAFFENDPDPAPGRIRWETANTFSPVLVGNTYTIGNSEFSFTVVSVTNPVTSMTVDYIAAEIQDQGGSDYFTINRYYRVTTVGGPLVANVTARYRDAEVLEQGFDESDLRLWLRTDDQTFSRLSGAGDIDMVNNFITANNVAFGDGNLPKILTKASANGPTVFDGNDEFFFSNTEDSESLPIELASFEIIIPPYDSHAPQLMWATATEKENYGFEIYRLKHAHDSTTGLEYEKLAFIEGAGTTTEIQAYSYTDRAIDEATTYAYVLRQLDYNGDSEDFGPWYVNIAAPEKTEIGFNFPNPFNPTTTIPFQIADRSRVIIQVYDLLGRMVQTLKDETMNPGVYTVSFEGSRFASGTYLIRLSSNGKNQIRRITLIK